MTISELENTISADGGHFLDISEKVKHITGSANGLPYEIKADVSPNGAVFRVTFKKTDERILVYTQWVHVPGFCTLSNFGSFDSEFRTKELSELLKEQIENLDCLKRAYTALEEMRSSGYLEKIAAQVKLEEVKIKF